MKAPLPSLIVLIAIALGAAGCEAQNGDSVSGKATYVKPATDSSGKPDPAAKPVQPQQSSDDFKVEVTLDATGLFQSAGNLACSATSGSLSAQSQSSGSVDSNGNYSSMYSDSNGSLSFSSPLCGAVKDVNVQSVTSISVIASVPANSQNCSDYCEAKAEASCESSADQVSCQASAKASCQDDCARSTKIVGHGQADASALAQVSSGWKSSASTDATVDLVFDSLQ